MQEPSSKLPENEKSVDSVRVRGNRSNDTIVLLSDIDIPNSYMFNKSLSSWLHHFGFTCKKESKEIMGDSKHIKPELKFSKRENKLSSFQLMVHISREATAREIYTSSRMIYGLCYKVTNYDRILNAVMESLRKKLRNRAPDKNIIVLIVEYANIGGHTITPKLT